MPTTITASITLPDDAPPTLHVQVDTETLAARDLTPAEVVAALGILAPETAAAWDPTTRILERLQAAVDEGKKAQAARTKALKSWRDALATAPDRASDAAATAEA